MIETDFKRHLHNKLCDIADLIMYQHNPCGLDGTGGCVKGQVKNCCHHTLYDVTKEGTTKCYFNSDKGCTIENLECKVQFCWEAFDKLDSKLKRLLKAIEMINRIYMLTTCSKGLYRPERNEYDYRDLAAYFDESFLT